MHYSRFALWRLLTIVFVSPILLNVLLPGGIVLAVRQVPRTCNWTTQPTPPFPVGNGLGSVYAESATNVWAVGSLSHSPAPYAITLAEHFDGTSWTQLATPNPGLDANDFTAVASVNATIAWAVGIRLDVIGSNLSTLIEKYNGTSWKYIASPNVANGSNVLEAIDVVSQSNIWTVGYVTLLIGQSDVEQTLILHWDGKSWQIVPSPNLGAGNNILYGIASSSAKNIWAVGQYAASDGNPQTLTEHYDGTAWNIEPSPSPGTMPINYLYSVAHVPGTKTFYAVGTNRSLGTNTRTLIEEYDGTAWSVVPSANQNTSDNLLKAVAVVNATDVYAVGYYYNYNDIAQTMIEQWDGTAWNIVSTPDIGTRDNYLDSVTALDAKNVWTVGQYTDKTKSPPDSQALVEYFC